MVFNTISVGTAVTPGVIETYFSHYLNRKPLRQKPTAHISYHEGVNLIRQFLKYASHHTVEDIQGFTSQWVPSPRWVKVEDITIPQKYIIEAADALITQLGHRGVDKVGGKTWWQWRRETSMLQAEWIEMKRDYAKRKASNEKGKRVMLYVHGGAYFFGSVDEHRYQLQRHARKLEARVFARILVILRDRGIPLPAGAILISPWVDLTHSFPSVAGDSSSDYIPPYGFLHRPSASWPPPNTDDMEDIAMHAVEQAAGEALPRKSTNADRRKAREESVQGFSVDHAPRGSDSEANADNPFGSDGAEDRPGNTIPGVGHDLSIMIHGNLVRIKDQIQMYTTNQLISHPLVSPILQPSLGGLPPLLILTGGGEILRDEQIYLAHKAANPAKYPPGDAYLDEYPEARDSIAKWKPTDVQLQVWDDLCHVVTTLSFTRPAKFMFRSIAQFAAWALARAQKIEIQIMDDDEMSLISSGSDTDSKEDLGKPQQTKTTIRDGVAQGGVAAQDQIGRAGDPLPAFKSHMIRQRVDRHGNIFPLDPPSELPALQMSANAIGVIKPGPVQKWLNAKKEWDSKYAKEKRKVQRQRAKEMAQGFQEFGDDEVPPPSALAARRHLGMPKEDRKGKSWGMMLWSLWGSSHDENTITREEKADKQGDLSAPPATDGASSQGPSTRKSNRQSRSRSRRRAVTDTGQTNNGGDHEVDEIVAPTEPESREKDQVARKQKDSDPNHLAPPTITNYHEGNADETLSPAASDTNRPTASGIAFPFKLGTYLANDGHNASTVTLTSQAGIVTPAIDQKGKQSEDPAMKDALDNNSRPEHQPAVRGKLGHDSSRSEEKAGEERRISMPDAKGVLHHGLAPEPSEDQSLTEGALDHDSSPSEQEAVDAREERRISMADTKGVLHHGLAPGGKAPESM